jgi:PAS domain S-box-containing protein
VALVLGAAVVRLALTPVFGEQLPFLTFFPAVAIAAWYGGFAPGLLATALSAVIASFAVPGSDSSAVSGAGYWLALALFIVMNLVVSALAEQLHRTRFIAAERLLELERNDTRARRLFQSNIIGVLFWGADGTVHDANDAFLATAGLSRDDLRSGRANWRTLVVPEFLPLHVAALEQIRTRGWSDAFDSLIVRPDGTRVPIYCGGVALDGNGSQGVTFVLDMTESNRTREALRESESRFRALFEDSPVALLEQDWSGVKRAVLDLGIDHADLPQHLITHPETFWACMRRLRVLNVNRVALGLLGLRDAAALQASVGTFVPTESIEPSVHGALALVLRGERARTEQHLVTRDGTSRDTMISMMPLPGHEAVLDRVLISMVDISERKRVEAEREELLTSTERARRDAEAANRAKDEFLATVSHELRTPLSPILAWARMLREGVLDADRTRHAYDVIERSARTQAQLIEDLLDVSRIMAGKMRLDVRPISLAPILERAVEVVRPSADAKGIRLHVVLDSEAGEVLGDDARLQQVVWNLLANAVKFTPKGGRIQLGLERVNSHLEIVVADSGDGMDPDFVPHVFDRFRQADASTTRAQSGLGLGLAIVRHIVEAHGGSVQAESAGRGHGSVFTVKLPLMVARSAATDRRHPTSGVAGEGLLPRLDGTRILVLDDESDAREVVSELLTTQGAEVRHAHSAEAARTLLVEWRPSLIVSDVGMPNEDGYAFIARWRSEAGDASRIPAVALTAYAGRTDKIRLLSAGFDAHVPKPLDPAELLTVLASLARSVRAN